jgi:hypothetical protein
MAAVTPSVPRSVPATLHGATSQATASFKYEMGRARSTVARDKKRIQHFVWKLQRKRSKRRTEIILKWIPEK